MLPSLDQYDTRNPLAIAAWAADQLALICSLTPVEYAMGDRAGRVVVLESLLRGILGTDDLQKVLARGDVPLHAQTAVRILDLYRPEETLLAQADCQHCGHSPRRDGYALCEPCLTQIFDPLPIPSAPPARLNPEGYPACRRGEETTP